MKKIDPSVAKFLAAVAVAALLLPFATRPAYLLLLLGATAVAMAYLTTYVVSRWGRHSRTRD